MAELVSEPLVAETKEKPTQNNKKGKTYLFIAVGIVGVVLLTMTVWDMATRNQVDKTKESSTQTLGQQEGTAQDFSNLVEQRTFSQQKREVAKKEAPINPHQAQVDRYEQAKQTTIARNQGLNQGGPPKEDPIAQARLKFDIAEMERVWRAPQSRWSQPVSGGARNNAAASQNRSLTTEEKRRELPNRISKAQNFRSEVVSGEFKGYPSSKQNQTILSLNTLNNSFKEPPSEIVGYTTQNKYEAGIEGKFKLPIGTVVPAITSMKTVSDYAGTMKGIVSQDIYDINYQFVLIPKGSEVIMKSVRISNVNEAIQARMGLTVPWIILPNGNKIDFSKSTGLDREGVAALKDKVNYHFLAQFLGVAAYALVANESSYQGSGSNNDSSFSSDVGESVRKQFSPLAQKYLNLVPTITLRAGQSMNIILEDEIYVEPWTDIYKDYLE